MCFTCIDVSRCIQCRCKPSSLFAVFLCPCRHSSPREGSDYRQHHRSNYWSHSAAGCNRNSHSDVSQTAEQQTQRRVRVWLATSGTFSGFQMYTMESHSLQLSWRFVFPCVVAVHPSTSPLLLRRRRTPPLPTRWDVSDRRWLLTATRLLKRGSHHAVQVCWRSHCTSVSIPKSSLLAVPMLKLWRHLRILVAGFLALFCLHCTKQERRWIRLAAYPRWCLQILLLHIYKTARNKCGIRWNNSHHLVDLFDHNSCIWIKG